MQLSGLGLTGPQAVYSLAIFLGRTYPDLVAGVDYRMPGAWHFKHVSECLYPIGVQLGRNLIDQALTAYIGGDGSPRKGFDYFATVASLLIPAEYIDDGDDTNETVSLLEWELGRARLSSFLPSFLSFFLSFPSFLIVFRTLPLSLAMYICVHIPTGQRSCRCSIAGQCRSRNSSTAHDRHRQAFEFA